MLIIIDLREACSITEESMDYSGDSEPLWISVPLFNTNSELSFQGKRYEVHPTRRHEGPKRE
jgi:hypothetical protein